MLMSWTDKEHPANPTATAAQRGVCLRARLSSYPVNTFGGGLGQRQAESIGSRQIRH